MWPNICPPRDAFPVPLRWMCLGAAVGGVIYSCILDLVVYTAVQVLCFFVDILSILESRTLKFPITIVAVSISPWVYLFFGLWCSIVRQIYVYNCYILMYLTLLLIYIVLFSLIILFGLKVCFARFKYSHTALFWLLFSWNIFLNPFTFNLFVSSKLK